MPKLTILNVDAVFYLREGTELARAPFHDPTIPLKFGCCKGECGTCAFKVVEGAENLSPLTPQEKDTLQRLKIPTHRLACQCAIKGDLIIELPKPK